MDSGKGAFNCDEKEQLNYATARLASSSLISTRYLIQCCELQMSWRFASLVKKYNRRCLFAVLKTTDSGKPVSLIVFHKRGYICYSYDLNTILLLVVRSAQCMCCMYFMYLLSCE